MTSARDAESLNQRIRNRAAEDGIPPLRLRNRIAFQRILARLSLDDTWILKGGFSLEMRLGLNARATKDLDLLKIGAVPVDALELQDALDEALGLDLRDGFSFNVRLPRAVRTEEVEPSTWRAVVDVRFGGAEFGTTTIDIVPRPAENSNDVELLWIEPALVGEPFSVRALDVNRHLAEKFHAFSRIYARDRPSSRVKDLVDIVLIAHSGQILPEPLSRALREVFAERGSALPASLPDTPRDWARSFTTLAEEAGADVIDIDAARLLASEVYRNALAQKGLE